MRIPVNYSWIFVSRYITEAVITPKMKDFLLLILLSALHHSGSLPTKPASLNKITPTLSIPTTTAPKAPKVSQVSHTSSENDLEVLIKQVFPSECGVENHHRILPIRRRRYKRVVNGFEAKKGQFPWQVALLFKGRHYCGGVIVHESYVVTGAHCFNPYTSHDPNDWIVSAGDHRLKNRDESEIQVNVTNITVHEQYISMWFEGITDTPPMNDIAILKLDHPLLFNTWHIKPICILRPNITFQWGEKCTVSGWGHLEWNGSQPNALNYAHVPLVSYEDCNVEKAYNGTIHETALCAGFRQGLTDACEYDSGGPLSCMKCGRYYLTGLVSWGDQCARPYKYGVYARMEKLTPWLVEKIAEDVTLKSASIKFRNG